MDARRFDSLTKRLSARWSRRQAVSAGAVLVAGAAGLRAMPDGFAQDATPVALDSAATPADRFVAISYYPYDGNFGDAAIGLKPALRLLQEQPGFITLSLIEEVGQIVLVTWFLDRTTSDAGAAALDAWIAEHDLTYLINTPERHSGAVFLRSTQPSGCWCLIGDDQACGGSEDLYCCALPDEERGICLTSATTCPIPVDEETNVDEENGATPTLTPTSIVASSCTSEGCDCVAGIDGACDDGLSCCGADELGGDGTCMTECPCGEAGCACIASVVNTCDEGLTCCAPGEIGGAGTCQYACTCTSEGCACTVGVDGACDADLVCCGIGSSNPGSIGVCLSACADDSPCPGAENCECGSVWLCNDGLVCCGATDDGGTGICMTEC